jgi:hypothetical protein
MESFSHVRDSEQTAATIEAYKSKLNLIATIVYKIHRPLIEIVSGHRATKKDVLKVSERTRICIFS